MVYEPCGGFCAALFVCQLNQLIHLGFLCKPACLCKHAECLRVIAQCDGVQYCGLAQFLAVCKACDLRKHLSFEQNGIFFLKSFLGNGDFKSRLFGGFTDLFKCEGTVFLRKQGKGSQKLAAQFCCVGAVQHACNGRAGCVDGCAVFQKTICDGAISPHKRI